MIRSVLALVLLTAPAFALDEAQGHDIVILGEVHDNGLHHEGQAELIRSLQPTAVVFEMLTPAQADTLNTMARSDMAEVAARIDWAGSGWPDFALYQPVFEALRDLPAVGAAAPKSKVRQSFSDGAAKVFGPDAPRFGLEVSLPEGQLSARKQMQFDAHCEAMPLEMMGGMVEAQRFRDAAFAKATLDALDQYGAPVVLIAGNGHARLDWGVPHLVATASPETRLFSVGYVEAPAGGEGDPRFDHTIVTRAAERGDPCEAFKS